MEISRTNTPRFLSECTRPDSSSARSASRIGPRLVPNRVASSLSLTRWPTASSPCRISCSISACTNAGSEFDCTSWSAVGAAVCAIGVFGCGQGMERYHDCRLLTINSQQMHARWSPKRSAVEIQGSADQLVPEGGRQGTVVGQDGRGERGIPGNIIRAAGNEHGSHAGGSRRKQACAAVLEYQRVAGIDFKRACRHQETLRIGFAIAHIVAADAGEWLDQLFGPEHCD